MKLFLIYIHAVCMLVLLAGCSGTPSDSITNMPWEKTAETSPVVNKESKAYLRGLTYGQMLSGLQDDSRQKERALIEYHSIVCMLESHGFSETAKAFAAGVQDACDNKTTVQ